MTGGDGFEGAQPVVTGGMPDRCRRFSEQVFDLNTQWKENRIRSAVRVRKCSVIRMEAVDPNRTDAWKVDIKPNSDDPVEFFPRPISNCWHRRPAPRYSYGRSPLAPGRRTPRLRQPTTRRAGGDARPTRPTRGSAQALAQAPRRRRAPSPAVPELKGRFGDRCSARTAVTKTTPSSDAHQSTPMGSERSRSSHWTRIPVPRQGS